VGRPSEPPAAGPRKKPGTNETAGSHKKHDAAAGHRKEPGPVVAAAPVPVPAGTVALRDERALVPTRTPSGPPGPSRARLIALCAVGATAVVVAASMFMTGGRSGREAANAHAAPAGSANAAASAENLPGTPIPKGVDARASGRRKAAASPSGTASPSPSTSKTPSKHRPPAAGHPRQHGTGHQAPAPAWQTRVVNATYVLNPGQAVSTNRIRLTLRTDGDLVLYNEHGSVVWGTGTRASGTHAVFQADGNFVLYSSSNATLWSSNTPGHDGAVLVLRSDGNMVITYRGAVIWQTGTAR
jgi:hypothetical protein